MLFFARIRLPESYPIAPALKKLMKAAAEETAGTTGVLDDAGASETQAEKDADTTDKVAKPVRRKRSAESAAPAASQATVAKKSKKAKSTKTAVIYPELDG